MALFNFGKKKQTPKGGDFSAYDTVDKIEAAVENGDLAPIYIISPMFGGAEDESNTLYVPPAVIPFKEGVDNLLADALESDKRVQGFSVKPEYRGSSRVPCSVHIEAGGDISLKETIHIW